MVFSADPSLPSPPHTAVLIGRFQPWHNGHMALLQAALQQAQQVVVVLAGGVTVVEGPGGTPQLQNQGGVPIVNIVAPNAGGLSHNQFLDRNVGAVRQPLPVSGAAQPA